MTSFIESPLFPVSRLSKESYKERKAGSGQTLTGLGKWWGRKPLVLVRATILGLLLESSPEGNAADLDTFLALMTMDDDGFGLRQNKSIPARVAHDYLNTDQRERLFVPKGKGVKWADRDASKEGQAKAFARMGYDDKLKFCDRPEQIEGPSPAAWTRINAHCGTSATSLQEWVEQRGQTLFGHTPRVGDAFCGGGSIPFEAARLGCEAYGSDLNPVAALLTWAALNIVGGGPEVQARVREAQEEAFAKTDAQITAWGIEHNEQGWRADAYLYCVETRSPSSGYLVPLAPNWIISEKYKVCGVLEPDHNSKRFRIRIETGMEPALSESQRAERAKTFAAARNGTVESSRLVDPIDGETHAMDAIRGDQRIDGKTQYGLRMWENEDLVPRPDDTFQERLYCIRYVDEHGNRHYVEPTAEDLQREQRVLELMLERFAEWQEKGYIPSTAIPDGGDKTEEPKRTRGWTHWHHLFNPRNLLTLGFSLRVTQEYPANPDAISLNLWWAKIAERHARLMGWDPTRPGGVGSASHVFTNQALNTVYTIATKGWGAQRTVPLLTPSTISSPEILPSLVENADSRMVTKVNEIWITDPPYADAVNYHELADFALCWLTGPIAKLKPQWNESGRPALAVKGQGESFNRSMVEVYTNLRKHMPDDGAQVVMFTHQSASVWADLALILWASGLRVTAAWTIQTETESAGLKTGNYVQGTVLMVLRKQTNTEEGFLTDIQIEVELEVKRQIDAMRRLDDKEQPNFGDADYQLAAYAAALRVLTGYSHIGDIDVQRELSRGAKAESEVEKVIESAVKVAMDYLVPTGIEEAGWRKLGAEERFYLKGLDVEQGGEGRNGVYTEMARGFGLSDYKQLLKTTKSNQTRLMTATEFGRSQRYDAEATGFAGSLTRLLLLAIRATVQADHAPVEGRNLLKAELPDYWADRQRAIAILDYLVKKTEGLGHWGKDRAAAVLLGGYLRGDMVG